MKLFAQLTKVDAAAGMIYGRMTEEIPDAAGEILDYESSKPNFKRWSDEIAEATGGLSLGNVRGMHGQVAAGKLTEISYLDEQKAIDVAAKIVDAAELEKRIEGVYTGLSIGGSYAKRWKDGNLMRYTALPKEVSLVDNPCLKTARFTLVKADGSVEKREFSDTERKELADKGHALPDGSFPIVNREDLENAVHAYGRAKDKEAAQKHIISRARALKATDLLPANWEGSTKEEKAESTSALAKAAARHSGGDLSKIQEIHNHSVALGADCPAAEKREVSEMQKSEVEQLIEARLGKVEQAQAQGLEKLEKAHAEALEKLEKAHAEALEKLEKANAEALEKLEKANAEALAKKEEEVAALKKDLELVKANTPKGGGPALRVVSKSQDLGQDDPAAKVETVKKADGSVDHEATAKEQMKAALANPFIIGRQ